jgi:hypothetical protein
MLPTHLRAAKDALKAMGSAKRSDLQDEVLAELEAIDEHLEKAKPDITKGILKRASAGYPVMGPTPDSCPTCGSKW